MWRRNCCCWSITSENEFDVGRGGPANGHALFDDVSVASDDVDDVVVVVVFVDDAVRP